MSPQPRISPRLIRQLEGRCCYGACPAQAADGSDYCAPHAETEAVRQADNRKRQRQARADVARCIESGCGRKVDRVRRADGSAVLRRCGTCARAKNVGRRTIRRGVTDHGAGVTSAVATAATVKLEVGRDGATRTRYCPRPGQRGGPSKEEVRRARLRLVTDALRLVGVFQGAYDEATLAQIDALPRIQRAEAKALLASSLVRAARLLLLVAEEEDPELRGTCAGCGRSHEAD